MAPQQDGGFGGFTVGGYMQGPEAINGYRLGAIEAGPTFDGSWYHA